MPKLHKVFLRGFSAKVFNQTKGHKLWQKEQLGRQRKNILRFLIILALAAIIFNLVFRFSQVTSLIFRPFNKLQSTLNYEKGLDFKTRVNILLMNLKSDRADELALLSYEQKEESLVVIFIPREVEVSLPKNYGTQPLYSSYWLGQTEKEKRGIDILLSSAQKALAVPIDGYISLEEVQIREENLKKLKEKLFTLDFFLQPFKEGWPSKQIKTSLSLKDFLSLSWKIKNTRSLDKLEFIYLDKTLKGVNFDPQLLDNMISENLLDTNLASEAKKIEIRNATQVSGMGNFVSRVIANMGLEVVSVKNEEQTTETLIYAKENSRTVAKLAKFLQVKIIREELPDAQGDIIIVLGRDFYHRLELISNQ